MADPERFTLTFNDQGSIKNPSEQDSILTALVQPETPVTDLWIFAYGWNTDPNDGSGTAVYDQWVATMWEQVQQVQVQEPTYHPLFVEVFWPSKAWVGEVSQPSVNNAAPINNQTVDDFVKSYRPVLDPQGQFGNQFDTDFGRIYTLLHQQQQPSDADVNDFVQILDNYTIEDPHNNQTEEDDVVNAPISEIAQRLQNDALVTQTGPAAAAALAPNDAANPIFDNLLNFLRIFTFWTMKARASIVGAIGLYPFLTAVRNKLSGNDPALSVRIHLLGHSFGAKLATTAVYSATDTDPHPFVDTLILLLGAFSQFSFTSNIPDDNGVAGHYVSVVTNQLTANPLMAIYSQYDLANKLFYPLGMLPVFTGVYEAPPPPPGQPFVSNDKYGSIGSNGAQAVDDTPHTVNMPGLGDPDFDWHSFKAQGVHCINVNGEAFINNGPFPEGAHNDFNHPEIFRLALAFSRQQ